MEEGSFDMKIFSSVVAIGTAIGYIVVRSGWLGTTQVQMKPTYQKEQNVSSWLLPINVAQWDEVTHEDDEQLCTRTTTVFSIKPIELVHSK